MYEKLIIWVIITLVPLIPTYVTHKVLQSNSSFKNTSQGIKLGGSIAAYFILLGVAFTSYNNMYSDPLEPIRHDLEGNWICNGTIINSLNEDKVNTTIESALSINMNSGGKLSLTGQVIDSNKFWQAEEVIVTPKKLIFIFQTPTQATGITWLSFSYQDDTIKALFGTWVITGQIGRGSLSCFRAVNPQ